MVARHDPPLMSLAVCEPLLVDAVDRGRNTAVLETAPPCARYRAPASRKHVPAVAPDSRR